MSIGGKKLKPSSDTGCSVACRVHATKFSLIRSLAQKLVMPAFEKGDLSVTKTCQFVFRANKQIKLVKENLAVCFELN